MPGLADEREEGERRRLLQEPEQERVAAADPVDERPRSDPGGEGGNASDRQREACLRERDPADVVEVDDDEREGHPVPERVDDSAALHEPDRPRQVRVQPSEVAVRHRGSKVSAWNSTPGS